jgi:hypothetical protein
MKENLLSLINYQQSQTADNCTLIDNALIATNTENTNGGRHSGSSCISCSRTDRVKISTANNRLWIHKITAAKPEAVRSYVITELSCIYGVGRCQTVLASSPSR